MIENLYINSKIKLKLDDNSKLMLDNESKICNKFYNLLLENIYPSLDKIKACRSAPSLNWMFAKIKVLVKEHPYLLYCNESVLVNTSRRLKEAVLAYYYDRTGKPKFKSYSYKWFSLYYHHTTPGFRVNGKDVEIPLGDPNELGGANTPIVRAKLVMPIPKSPYPHLSYRIVKELDTYFLVTCLKLIAPPLNISKNRVIAIDLNHENFFKAIDNIGVSFCCENPIMIKGFNKELKKLKLLRKKYKCETAENQYGAKYKKKSLNFKKIERIIMKLFIKRKVQLKQFMFKLCKWLTENYDIIIVGNYVPTPDLASSNIMRKSMINFAILGEFRTILSYVCQKNGKKYIRVNEAGTTKKCFFCGDIQHKDPSIRSYQCPVCGKSYDRDINSAINIGIKGKYYTKDLFKETALTKPTHIIRYNLHEDKLEVI